MSIADYFPVLMCQTIKNDSHTFFTDSSIITTTKFMKFIFDLRVL